MPEDKSFGMLAFQCIWIWICRHKQSCILQQAHSICLQMTPLVVLLCFAPLHAICILPMLNMAIFLLEPWFLRLCKQVVLLVSLWITLLHVIFRLVLPEDCLNHTRKYTNIAFVNRKLNLGNGSSLHSYLEHNKMVALQLKINFLIVQN